MTERRKQQRSDLMAGVQYARSSNPSGIITRGVIRNYSNDGICLIASHPLMEGVEIIIKSLVDNSSKKAIVRWQQQIDNDSYNVGLEYVKAPKVDHGFYCQRTPDADTLIGRYAN